MREVRTGEFISFRVLLILECRRWGHHLPTLALWNIGLGNYKLRWSQLLEPLLHLTPSLYLILFQPDSETLFAFIDQILWESLAIILCAASVGTLSERSISHYVSLDGTIQSETLSGVHAHNVLTITSCCDRCSTIFGILKLHGLCYAYRLHLASCRVLYRCLWLIGACDRQDTLHHILWFLDLLVVRIVGGSTATRLL